jgi:hypothetical protein
MARQEMVRQVDEANEYAETQRKAWLTTRQRHSNQEGICTSMNMMPTSFLVYLIECRLLTFSFVFSSVTKGVGVTRELCRAV